MAWSQDRVGYFASSMGGGGFMTYTENDTTSNISGRVTSSGGAFQNAEVKSFIERQRSTDYSGAGLNAAGAGVPVIVLGNNGLEVWSLYLTAGGDVARGGSNFINS